MNLVSANNIGSKETAILALGVGFLLLTSHYFFGLLGIIGVLSAGILILTLPILRRVQGSLLLIYFASIILVLDTRDGLPIIELPFFCLSLLLVLHVLYLFATGSIELDNSLDYIFLLFHFLIPYAVILGNINGADTYSTISEIKYFIGIFTYFPLKIYLPNKTFQKILAFILSLVLIYVLIRNFFYYRQLIIQAVVPWQAENARVASNELIVVFGCSLTFSVFSLVKSKVIWVTAFIFFALFSCSLVITQSRGFWIATFISLSIIFMLSPKSGKKRIVGVLLFFGFAGGLFAFLFLDDLVYVVLNGLSERFKSIGAGSKDNSLYDRWLESKTVFSLILKNPIAGYGLGVEFTRKVIFFDYFIRTSYIHNGYLAIFYKFGILGFLSVLFMWVKVLKEGIILLFRDKNRIILTSIIGLVSGMIVVNLTSPIFLYFEGTLFTTLFCAYVNSITTTKFSENYQKQNTT